MAQEFKLGLMVLDMKEIGKTTKRMVRENSGMLMEISSKGNGKMIKQMDMVFIFM